MDIVPIPGARPSPIVLGGAGTGNSRKEGQLRERRFATLWPSAETIRVVDNAREWAVPTRWLIETMANTMRPMPIPPALLLAVVLALAPAAANAQDAGKSPAAMEPADTTPAVTVTDLTLGMYVTQDKRIAVPMTTFRPEDTISLCITTLVAQGAVHSGTLGVWWTFGEGETLRSLKSDVAEMLFDGEGRVVFTIENPRTWPVGLYHVEVFLDGASVGRKDFTIQ